MKRPTCTTCLRAQSACICQWITPTAHTSQVLILQHPSEVNQAKGSARLLHLSLQNSLMLTGETFDKQTLGPLLTNPPAYTVLLYPDHAQDTAVDLVPAPALAPAALHDPAHVRLVVLDGTWRKSRKMLYLNPLLQQLPRLSLHHHPASRYYIRTAHKPHQLSTLEATCAALAQVESNATPFAPLLAAFDGFVAQQMAFYLR
jgi:DTW domain-containing protein